MTEGLEVDNWALCVPVCVKARRALVPEIASIPQAHYTCGGTCVRAEGAAATVPKACDAVGWRVLV